LKVFKATMMASMKAHDYLDEGLSDVDASVDDLVAKGGWSNLKKTFELGPTLTTQADSV
jgi:hypothetical protein